MRKFGSTNKDLLLGFEKVMGSHHLGHVKPEKAIYDKALNLMEVSGKETIFLDDKLENIEGAEKVGIAGILVETPSQMYAKLNELGVLRPELYEQLQASLV